MGLHCICVASPGPPRPPRSIHWASLPAQSDLWACIGRWLSKEREFNKADGRLPDGTKAVAADQDLKLASWNNGWAGGRLASSIKHSSNAVLR